MRTASTKLHCDFHNAASKKNVRLIDATSRPKPLNLEKHIGRILLAAVLVAWVAAWWLWGGH